MPSACLNDNYDYDQHGEAGKMRYFLSFSSQWGLFPVLVCHQGWLEHRGATGETGVTGHNSSFCEIHHDNPHSNRRAQVITFRASHEELRIASDVLKQNAQCMQPPKAAAAPLAKWRGNEGVVALAYPRRSFLAPRHTLRFHLT